MAIYNLLPKKGVDKLSFGETRTHIFNKFRKFNIEEFYRTESSKIPTDEIENFCSLRVSREPSPKPSKGTLRAFQADLIKLFSHTNI